MNLFLLSTTLCCFLTIPSIAGDDDAVRAANPRFPCGVRMRFGVQLIHGGWTAELGQWPWHAALYHGADYKCGATLIDQRHVLTAAYCVTARERSRKKTKKFEYSLVYPTIHLGKTVLDEDPEDRVQVLNVSEIHLHPEFSLVRHDLALLVLSQAVKFSEHVIPICIEGIQATKSADLVGQRGWVAGFGSTKFDKISNQLKTATMLVVNDTECIQSDPLLFGRFVSPGMFCASDRNGTSICNGDGGGGLYLRDLDRWVLRGISYFAGITDTGSCDVYRYAAFTNVAYYYEWIKKKISVNEPLDTDQDRISRLKCQEYAKFTRKSSKGICYNARNPHTVAVIDLNQRHIVSGTIISEKFVLTKAPARNDTFASDLKTGNLLIRIGTKQGLKVTRVVVHPDYDPEANRHSILLLELESSLTFKKQLIPACLANPFTESLNNALLLNGYTGPSSTDVDFFESDESRVLTSFECNATVHSTNQSFQLHEEEFCTTSRYDESVSLDGLLGGPLQVFHARSCMSTVVGVVKLSIPQGMDEEAAFRFTNVYFRVSDYLDWIESVVWGEKKSADEI